METKGGDRIAVDISQVDHVGRLGEAEVLLQFVDEALLVSEAGGGEGGDINI